MALKDLVLKSSIRNLSVIWIAVVSVMGGTPRPLSQAEIRPELIFSTGGAAQNPFRRDGILTGGDALIREVVVQNIRRAPKLGFERIVLDLEGKKQGEATPIQGPPAYHVAVNSDESRIVVTLSGKVRLAFVPTAVVQSFKKSTIVEKIQLFPVVEEKSWTFSIDLKAPQPVKVTELSSPARLVLDIQTASSRPLPHSAGSEEKPFAAPSQKAGK